MKLVWRTVFREKGYWEAELDCKVWSLYVCRDDCGKLIKLPGNRPLGRRWIKQEDYDEIVGYGSWTDVGTPSGPWDIDAKGPRPRITR
jgi:hypothetical protein